MFINDIYLFTYTSVPENYDTHLEDVTEMLQFFVIK